MPIPVHTPRLTLRPFEPGDFDALLDIYRRPDVVRYLYTEAWSAMDAEEKFGRKMASRALEREHDVLVLAIVPVDASAPVGEVVLKWLSDEHRRGEVGFVLHPDVHGRGYAREAAEAMLQVGFEALRFHRIIGRCDARNAASARLMERLGMRREAHFRHDERFKGEWSDTLVYAILDDEWRVIKEGSSESGRVD